MSRVQTYNPGLAELGRKDQPGGYLGIPESGVVLGNFGQYYDTAVAIAAIVLEHGQLAFTTDTKEWFIGDGTTSGGVFLYQSPIQKEMTATELASPGAVATADNSLLFPRAINAEYLVHVEVDFEALGGAASNFGIKVDPGFTPGYTYFAAQRWYDRTNDGLLLEERRSTASDGPLDAFLLYPQETASLSLDFASLTADIRMHVRSSPATNTGQIAVTPVTRTGAAPASGVFLVASVKRVS